MIPFAELRLKHRPWTFAGIKTVNIVVNIAMNIILVGFAGMGIEGVFIASLTAALVSVATDGRRQRSYPVVLCYASQPALRGHRHTDAGHGRQAATVALRPGRTPYDPGRVRHLDESRHGGLGAT